MQRTTRWHRLRDAAIAAVAALVTASTVLVVSASPASAAVGAGRIQLCVKGNYSAQVRTWVEDPHSPGSQVGVRNSGFIAPGKCTVPYSYLYDPSLGAFAELTGRFNTSNGTFSLVTLHLWGRGLRMDATGTTQAGHRTYQIIWGAG